MPMNSELRAGYRAEVERKGRALKAMREARGVRSDKGPCAFDKVQLKDWYTSLQIANEEWRCAYVTAMVDYWFTGVTPDYLDDIPKAYFNANFERLSDARRQSFAKSDTGEDSSLEAWVDGRNGTIPADGEGVPNPYQTPFPAPYPTPYQMGFSPYIAISYQVLAMSHKPLAMALQGHWLMARGLRATERTAANRFSRRALLGSTSLARSAGKWQRSLSGSSMAWAKFSLNVRTAEYKHTENRPRNMRSSVVSPNLRS